MGKGRDTTHLVAHRVVIWMRRQVSKDRVVASLVARDENEQELYCPVPSRIPI
jgi:hypothetical protein